MFRQFCNLAKVTEEESDGAGCSLGFLIPWRRIHPSWSVSAGRTRPEASWAGGGDGREDSPRQHSPQQGVGHKLSNSFFTPRPRGAAWTHDRAGRQHTATGILVSPASPSDIKHTV